VLNLRMLDLLLGLSIVCMALAASERLLNSFLMAYVCTVIAGANRHYELTRAGKPGRR
jgi:hypothetical protein